MLVSSKKVFLFLASVKETRKPTKPVIKSVITNPNRVNTKTFSSVTAKRVVNKKIDVNSRIPRPAKVIGRKPAVLAIGNNSKKYK